MSRLCIVLFIGLPGAGKTTFCGEIKSKLGDFIKDCTAHVIEYDQHASSITYKAFRQKMLTIVEKLVITLLKNSDLNVILVDDNMYYRSMRYNFYKLAKKFEISLLQVYMNVDLNVALTRNSQRENPVSADVVIKMSNAIEKSNEEAWEKYFLANGDFYAFVDLLMKSLADPVKGYELTAPKQSITQLQTIDLLLRKIVNEKIALDRNKAKILVLKRKDIFDKIKQNHIEISSNLENVDIYDVLLQLFKL